MSSFTFGEGFVLTAKNYFIAPIDYNHRALAWWSVYGDYGIYVEYTRATCEFCLYVIVAGQLIHEECKVIDTTEWDGSDSLWHELSIRYVGEQIEVSRDDKLDFQYDDGSLKGFLREGYVHLIGTGCETCFDDVSLLSLISYVCGDADGSQKVDIDDVVYLITYIFSGGPAPNPLNSGDADCSTAIDIDDVVYLITYIFSGGPAPCAGC